MHIRRRLARARLARRLVAALVGAGLLVFLASVCAASGAPAAAQHETLDITGVWTASQSNAAGNPITYHFVQRGSAVTGSARYLSCSATVTGTLTGNTLDMRSAYDNGVVSVHTATVTQTPPGAARATRSAIPAPS